MSTACGGSEERCLGRGIRNFLGQLHALVGIWVKVGTPTAQNSRFEIWYYVACKFYLKRGKKKLQTKRKNRGVHRTCLSQQLPTRHPSWHGPTQAPHAGLTALGPVCRCRARLVFAHTAQALPWHPLQPLTSHLPTGHEGLGLAVWRNISVVMGVAPLLTAGFQPILGCPPRLHEPMGTQEAAGENRVAMEEADPWPPRLLPGWQPSCISRKQWKPQAKDTPQVPSSPSKHTRAKRPRRTAEGRAHGLPTHGAATHGGPYLPTMAGKARPHLSEAIHTASGATSRPLFLAAHKQQESVLWSSTFRGQRGGVKMKVILT